MWAEWRETTKKGQCPRSRKKTESFATPDLKEQGYYDLEPEACVKRATWSKLWPSVRDSANPRQPHRETAEGLNTMASLFPPSHLLGLLVG